MKHTLFFILISLASTCCTFMEQIEYADYTILRSEDGDFSDLEKFDSDLGGYANFLFFVDKEIIYRVAAISYSTVDPFGNQVMASGLVYHPLNRKSKGVIDVLPIARIGGSGVSVDFFTIEAICIFVDYTIIIPDLLGFGVSKETTKSPFLMIENIGRVAYDMRCAAAQYLWDTFRYSLPSETIIMGYSLGGSAALATQKYYETNHSNSIKVKEVIAGGGAYDLPAAFAAFAKTEFSDYPSIPNTIMTFNHYYNLDLDFTQIFSGDLLNNYTDWYTTGKIEPESHYLRTYLHEDFFKPLDQQNDEFKKLQRHLIENSVSEGWRPKAPIYLIHSKDDTHVPLENAQVTVSKLRKAGANISFSIYPGDHTVVGNTYMLRTILHLKGE